MSPKSWKTLNVSTIYSTTFFSLVKEKCQLASKKIMPKYYIMNFADWVMVIPKSSDGRLVMVEQFRNGSKSLELEFPGGTTEPQSGESHEQAALRELVEETGYTSQKVSYLGFVHPNPALQNNKMHIYLAEDCERAAELNLDPFEEIEVKLIKVDEIQDLISQNKINHSVVLAALTLWKGF